MQRPPIHWANLIRSLEHFVQTGFAYMEVPWVVDSSITQVTAPKLLGLWQTAYGDLLGSAEQAFIEMLRDNTLPKGRYSALTPCFREEPTHTPIHRPYFAKVELIVVGEDVSESLAQDCCKWFQKSGAIDANIVATTSGFDVVYKDVEIGSYGYREIFDQKYTYGTGMAEPRFSFLLQNLKRF